MFQIRVKVQAESASGLKSQKVSVASHDSVAFRLPIRETGTQHPQAAFFLFAGRYTVWLRPARVWSLFRTGRQINQSPSRDVLSIL